MSTPAPDPENPLSDTAPQRISWVLCLLVCLYLVHFIQATRLFPSVGAIFDPATPVLVVDHTIHEYHGALGAQFLRASGRTWGYDPFFMAGYPETPVWDSSSNSAILFNLAGNGQEFRGYKVGLWLFSLVLLPAITLAARLVGLTLAEATLATFFAWLVFWTGFPVNLWRSGLFGFTTVAACVGVLLGLCVRYHLQPSWRTCVALALTAASLFFVHVTTPVQVFGGPLAFYVLVARRHGIRWHAGIWLAVAFTVAVNLIWLIPLWNFNSIRSGGGSFLVNTNVLYLYTYFKGANQESRVALILLILGLIGLIRWWMTGMRPAAAAFGGSIFFLLFLTGLGSVWGLTRGLEPLRFRVVVLFLLTVPASSALIGLSQMISRRISHRLPRLLLAPALWLSLIITWGVLEPTMFGRFKFSLTRHRPLVVGFTPEMQQLTDWIKQNTDLSARILLEDQLRLNERTDPESTHWTPLLPKLLAPEGRLFIGGLYQFAFIKHRVMASFGDFTLGPLPISEWNPFALSHYFEQYNIGWVICWSPLSRFWFDNLPDVERVATIPRYCSPNIPVSGNELEWKTIIGRIGFDAASRYMIEGEHAYAIYRIKRPRNYFLKGKGRLVSAAPDRLEFADLEPDNGSVIISLHWLDTWQSDPPAQLLPCPTQHDPVDFVQINLTGPIPRLVLSNGRPGKSP